MNRRIIGSIILAAGFAMLLLGASIFLSGGSSASASVQPPNIAAVPGDKEVVLAQAKDQPGQAQATAVAGPNGAWQDIAPFPSVSIPPTPGSIPLRLKRANAAAYPPNGKLYVLGGRAGTDGDDTTLRNIFEYTPSTNSWVQKAGLLDDSAVGSRWTANMAVAVLTDTSGVRIYAIGGTNIDAEPSNRVRVYDPIADTVTLLTSDAWPANPVRNPGAWAVYNNKLYIYGGFSSIGPGAVFPETWVFDPLGVPGSKWQQLTSANLPTARGFMAGALLDGQIYAIGGNTWITSPRTLVPSNLVHRMNPALPSPTWTAVANLPTARGDMGAWAYDTGTGYEISGKIAIAGGVFPTPDAQGYLYDPPTNSWGAFPNMVHATRNYGYAQLDGYLYAFGGYDYTAGLPQGANWNQRYDATQGGTPTSTVTGTPPTATRTSTPLPGTNTPTRTATIDPCLQQNYVVATATGTVVAGTTLLPGSSCDDCSVSVTFPFSVRLYGATYTTANAISNGNVQFTTTNTAFTNTCLPATGFGQAIFPYWDDLLLTGAGQGIYTAVLGTAPNRTFVIEWRGGYFSGGGTANISLLLPEGNSGNFSVIYGTVTQGNTSATVGVQNGAGLFTQYVCNGSGGPVTTGLRLNFTLPSCPGTNTPGVPTNTVAPTNTVVLPTPTCAPAGTTDVSIVDLAFNPQVVTIGVGSTVRWTNTGQLPHTSTSTTGVWNSGTLNNGQQFSFTFNTPGVYPYFCEIHPTMTGTVIVTGACPTSTVQATVTRTSTAAPTPTVVCPPGGISDVAIGTFFFNPQTVTIGVGATVRWTNTEAFHSTVSDTGLWDSGTLGQGQQFSFTFNTPGVYPYRCGLHPKLHSGTVIVTGACPTQTVPTVTRTATAVATSTVCTIQFSDVPPDDTFYFDIRCLACRGIVGGYADGTFRTYNMIVRGQIAKMVSNSAGLSGDPDPQIYTDVPSTDTFYTYINRLTRAGAMGGYPCGTVPSEPCDTQNRPYFRPYSSATRGQISQIVARAANLTGTPSGQTFTDVPVGSTFYVPIEQLYALGVITGYPCGGVNPETGQPEPCDTENRPYFRPNNRVNRGQASKITANTFFPGCTVR